MKWLEALAEIATIATAVVAVWAYGSYRLKLRSRRIAVEGMLAKKSRPNDDSIAIAQLAADLKLTPDQVLEAAQASKKIEGYGGQLADERRLRYRRK